MLKKVIKTENSILICEEKEMSACVHIYRRMRKTIITKLTLK